MIPYGRQSIDQSDIDSVIEVLKSPWLTQGPTIENFEKKMAEYCGARFAVAVSNATAALHISCKALNLGPSDLLLTSPNTFVASANCGKYCGADVDFIDIELETYNLDLSILEKKLKAGQRPKVVIPVHFAGHPCDLEWLMELKKAFGFYIVEDASHAVGAEYKGNKIGNGQYSDLTVFSFHPVKIMTTGEGGLISTNNEMLYNRLLLLRSHGITRNTSLMEGGSHGPWYYSQLELGFNYRMTDLQAALGVSQLTKVDAFIERRRYLVERYHQLLKDLPVKCPKEKSYGRSAWHLYPIWVDHSQVRIKKKELFQKMLADGIGVNLHYIPVPSQPYYQKIGFQGRTFPQAENYYGGAMSLPLFPALKEEEQDRVVATLRRLLLGVNHY